MLSAWAMQTLPASHGALVNGLQPLCVALYAAWLSHERPSKAFWACAALGSGLVLSYALITGAGSIQAGDLLMLGAIAVGGLGYAEGGRLAKEMGGWQVICWALVLSTPLLIGPVAISRVTKRWPAPKASNANSAVMALATLAGGWPTDGSRPANRAPVRASSTA